METAGKALAEKLKLYGLVAHWESVSGEPWVGKLLQWEREERQRRSLERRVSHAHLGHYKPLVDFDWNWPQKIDRDLLEELFRTSFVEEGTNVILMGPNGVGKTMLARNLAHAAVMHGHSALVVTASDMLAELGAQETASLRTRRLKRFVDPKLLVVDELGYLSYGQQHADLLFEVVSRRYQHNQKRSTVVTTNKPFSEWNQVFPNAACLVTLIDRLVHHAEVVAIEAESYRLKEAQEQAQKKRSVRSKRRGGAQRDLLT